MHFAAREGHVDAVRLLLDAGADPEENGLNDRTLIEMARERGHEAIAQMLERARDRPDKSSRSRPIIPFTARRARRRQGRPRAARCGPQPRGSRPIPGGTPLHRAVLGGQIAVTLLLDRGADIHAWTLRRVARE